MRVHADQALLSPVRSRAAEQRVVRPENGSHVPVMGEQTIGRVEDSQLQ